MFPLVKINDGAVNSKTIIKLEVQHAMNTKDSAIIQIDMPAGGMSYAAKQPVQIAMASGGPTLFDGYVVGVKPISGKGNAGARITCLSSARAHAQESAADTTFLDTPGDMLLQTISSPVDNPRVELELEIRNSRETTSLMYELNMLKKIDMAAGGRGVSALLENGYFAGYIAVVDRTYTRESDRHGVRLVLTRDKLVNFEPRHPNVFVWRDPGS